MFRKRFIALVMALTMLFTLIAPSFAWALEGDGTDGDGDPAIVNPDPVADPEPDPDPDPVADPEPDPDPDPVADPEPDPDPDPVADPEPDPDPDPVADPEPDPDPDPVDDLGDPDDPAPDPDPQAPATRSILEDGWYVIGLRGWAVSDLSADDKFEGPNADGVYTLEKELLANSEFKAVKVEHDAITQWYPVGEGNNQGNGDNPGLFTIYLKVDSFLRPSKVPSTVANGFHLNGTFNNWNLAKVEKLEQLSGSAGNYYIDKTFTEETSFKVINNYYGEVIWYPSGDNITVSAGHYRITFDGSIAGYTRYYTITWNNDDGTLIDTTEVLAGDFPQHSDPQKAGYHFAGWDPDRQFANGNATYTAVFHQLTEHTAKEATCTETGNKAYWSCAKCNTTYKNAYGTEEADTNYIVVPALGHDYVAVVTEPTCSQEGYTTYTCSRCGDSYRVNETPATGIHVWGDPAWGIPQNDGSGWTVTVTFTCNTCSAPATLHAQLVGDVTTEPATCVACGYKQATFETNPDGQQRFAETITWDQTEGPDASAHPTSLEAYPAVPATCTEAGNSAYWYCPTCEKYFSNAEGTDRIGVNSLVIPAGHTMEHHEAKDATCTEAGNTEYWKCIVCGKYFSDANGENEIVENSWILPACHHFENGECTVCHTVAVAKIGDEYFTTLQAAVDKARTQQSGTVTVMLIAETTENVKYVQKRGLNMVIAGNVNDKPVLNGQIMIFGGGFFDIDSVTIEGIKFVQSDTMDDTFIYLAANAKFDMAPYVSQVEGTIGHSDAHNITVKNCEFVGTDDSKPVFKAASDTQANTVVLSGLKATGVHSLGQFTGTKYITIENCDVAAHNGINISGDCETVTIENNKLVTDGYALRMKEATAANKLIVTLSGNDFVGATEGSYGVFIVKTGTLNVESGNYKGLFQITESTKEKMNITGGLFTVAPLKAYCAEGLYPMANPDSSTTADYPYTVGIAVSIMRPLPQPRQEGPLTTM